MKVPVDTLVCDTARITAWQQDTAYDYNREPIEPQESILEWLFSVLMGFLREMIGAGDCRDRHHPAAWPGRLAAI